MADAPTPRMLARFRQLAKEANDCSYSHDEYLTLMFMAAVDLERARERDRRRYLAHNRYSWYLDEAGQERLIEDAERRGLI